MRGEASIISNFDCYPDADAAVTKLTSAGYSLRDLGIIGEEYHTEPGPAAWFAVGERIKRWSVCGAIAGGASALVLGAIFTPTSISGNVFLLGYMAAVLVCIIEGAAAAGGLGLAGALVCNSLEQRSGGIRSRHVTKADSYLLVARGTAEQAERARALIAQ